MLKFLQFELDPILKGEVSKAFISPFVLLQIFSELYKDYLITLGLRVGNFFFDHLLLK